MSQPRNLEYAAVSTWGVSYKPCKLCRLINQIVSLAGGLPIGIIIVGGFVGGFFLAWNHRPFVPVFFFAFALRALCLHAPSAHFRGWERCSRALYDFSLFPSYKEPRSSGPSFILHSLARWMFFVE
ncbi:hypothetical protein BKA65DRAFT_91028 [Rhexocercosporidium sp. MPI-PUGE-AT-0058]|nr:hypothetical protein BKA65DRAFT_91028 [Rhexocercosporidium sp. MPI-PUGE-AT-0058]